MGSNSFQTLKRADELIFSEEANAAIDVMKEYLIENDHPMVWWKLSTVYQITGELVIARAILRNIISQLSNPHITDIIAAGLPFGKPHIMEDIGVIYFSIPKCGSSTVKDALLIANGEEASGELSHQKTQHLTRVIPFESVRNEYRDLYSFAIIRHPRSRLRSYWQKNISESHSLSQEARGRDSFYGLSTIPSYEEILRKFDSYRCTFRDFRHHTDRIAGYIGPPPSSIVNIYGMSQLSEAVKQIGARASIDIPDLRNMASKQSTAEFPGDVIALEDGVLESFYQDEISQYFS